jgi:hypothetical protein
MSVEIAAVFNELFFGAGCWLGILLIEIIVWTLASIVDWGSFISIIITIFIGIDYLNNTTANTDQVWLALIMFFTSIFLIVNLVKRKK